MNKAKLQIFLQNKFRKLQANQKGVALFMVMMALAVVGVMVTEFTYTAHMNYSMAQSSAEAAKSLYLAKSGLQIAKLRLKIYKEVKKFGGCLLYTSRCV